MLLTGVKVAARRSAWLLRCADGGDAGHSGRTHSVKRAPGVWALFQMPCALRDIFCMRRMPAQNRRRKKPTEMPIAITLQRLKAMVGLCDVFETWELADRADKAS
jgi:hypothetical protein